MPMREDVFDIVHYMKSSYLIKDIGNEGSMWFTTLHLHPAHRIYLYILAAYLFVYTVKHRHTV